MKHLLCSMAMLATTLVAQPAQITTATVDTSIFWSAPGDGEMLLVTYAIGSEAGNTVTVRDPALWSPPYIAVQMQPVWVYAQVTRTEFLGMRPCFHTIAERDCLASRTVHLNVIESCEWMAPLEFTPAMPHHAIWRMDYPGGPTWLGGPGTPELVAVWFRVNLL